MTLTSIEECIGYLGLLEPVKPCNRFESYIEYLIVLMTAKPHPFFVLYCNNTGYVYIKNTQKNFEIYKQITIYSVFSATRLFLSTFKITYNTRNNFYNSKIIKK